MLKHERLLQSLVAYTGLTVNATACNHFIHIVFIVF